MKLNKCTFKKKKYEKYHEQKTDGSDNKVEQYKKFHGEEAAMHRN
jgi:hypothetical protein